MTPSAKKLEEFYTLLNAYSEQELTPVQLARLESLVIQEPELRQRYLVYLQWHSAVERYGLPLGPGTGSSFAGTDEDECFSSEAANETTPPLPPPIPPLAPPTSFLSGLSGASTILLLCGVLAVTIAIVNQWWDVNPLDGVRRNPVAGRAGVSGSDSPVGIADAQLTAVATLVDSSDCEWGPSTIQTAGNLRLSSGWLSLASGMAAIKFDCGNTVLLQGPAEFALNSAECGTLRSGRLVSKAVSPNSGFTILTGNTEIVDQGTEFGVFADNGGSTEVHVFDGVAKVRQRGVSHGAIPERFLKAGQATRFEAKPAGATKTSVNRLDGPVGITFGPDGHLYVASRFTDSILRYDGETGALRDTFVGPRSGELNNPFFLAFGPDGKLYISSTGNHSVLRFDGRTGEFCDAFVPPRSGDIAGPMGLAFGRDGNLYVASSGKQTVCRFDGQTGAPLGKFFESGSGGLNGPTGIAFGPEGDLWVADRNRDCVLRYDGESGKFVARHALDGKLKFPFDVAFSPAGELYVASHSNHQILRFNPASGATSAGIDESQAPSWPHAVTFGADGRLYCTSDSANAVMRYEAGSGAFVDVFVVSWQDLQADKNHFVLEMPDRVVCNTGLSRAGQAMLPGEHCPRWFIEKSPDPRFIPPGPAVVTDALPGWQANSDRSSWLSIAPLREDYRAAAGQYIFYAGFEVNAQDLPTARLVGTGWTPQQLVDVQINKQSVPVKIETQADGQSATLVCDQGFVEGLNFIYFIVDNANEGPVAFRAELDFIRNRDAGKDGGD